MVAVRASRHGNKLVDKRRAWTWRPYYDADAREEARPYLGQFFRRIKDKYDE